MLVYYEGYNIITFYVKLIHYVLSVNLYKEKLISYSFHDHFRKDKIHL